MSGSGSDPTVPPEHVDAPEHPKLTLAELVDEVAVAEEAFGSGGFEEVAIVDGVNVAVRVRDGCLELVDGYHPSRRVRRVPRSDRVVQRVVVLGAGYVTTEAMTWCYAKRLPMVVVRSGSTPTMVSAPALYDHAGLRRAQALAGYVVGGLDIARWLVGLRIGDQARIAGDRLERPDLAEAITAQLRTLGAARSVGDAMLVEGRAAGHYWRAWQDCVRLRFAASPPAPDGWQYFNGRHSPLRAQTGNRHASSPVNASLNLAYKIGESEAVFALAGCGLDAGLGLLHSDVAGRSSAALDLLEAGRGAAEECVLDLLVGRTLRRRDFAELPDGEVRLRATLSHELVASVSASVRAALAPVAAELARRIVKDSGERIALPGPADPPPRRRPLRVVRRCSNCGDPLQSGERHATRCDSCGGRQGPGRTSEVREAERAWAAEHPVPLPCDFEPIRLALAGLTVTRIAQACGVSRQTAWRWREGTSVPHPRRWEALARLAEGGQEK